MSEREWVEGIASRLRSSPLFKSGTLEARTQEKLSYGCEIRRYGDEHPEPRTVGYVTDLLIVETADDGTWVPRVVIEAKYASVTTHDAITYSQKARAHRAVHPYLRYGVMLGDRKHHPLPGFLLRHGQSFDFMFSFCSAEPSEAEWTRFTRLVRDEVKASRLTEKLTYETRGKDRPRHTLLHRKLVLE